MADTRSEFEQLRNALAAADEALAEALDERARTARALSNLKQQAPDAFFSLPRDADVIATLARRVREFPEAAGRAVMTEVISGCQSLVSPVTVAFMGAEGGFAHLAARRHFGMSASLRQAGSAEAVVTEIESGRCSFGVLPYETPYDGAVTNTMSALARSDVKIGAEVRVRHGFHVLSSSGDATKIKRIYGTTMALEACLNHLALRYPDAVQVDMRSGQLAAKRAEADDEGAAVTTALVMERSPLQIVEEHVEDASDLHTRFIIVGHDYPARTGRDRTAIALALNDAPGVLMAGLRPLAERKVNVERLETRPARGWELRYLVLIEVSGHVTDRNLLSAIEDLRQVSPFVRVLGSYPVAE